MNPELSTTTDLRRTPLKGPFRLLSTALLIAVMSALAFGQGDQGRIAGTVEDASGAVIPGVTITITSVRTGEQRTVLTADSGNYVMPALRASEYAVSASLPGFATLERKSLQLVAGQRLDVNFTLQTAAVATTVNVETADVPI